MQSAPAAVHIRPDPVQAHSHRKGGDGKTVLVGEQRGAELPRLPRGRVGRGESGGGTEGPGSDEGLEAQGEAESSTQVLLSSLQSGK